MRLTVFTPTYNRVDLLYRTYNSLTQQTCKDFEWLIVDDGSTDGTGKKVEEWIAEKKITIRYYYRENGGKMRAHNEGVALAKAPLFMCVDSDDYLTTDAVQSMLECFDRSENHLEKGLCIGGVVSHKGKNAGELLGASDFPQVEYSTLYGLYLMGFSGETTLMYRTELLKKYPFPEIDGEKYVPEDYVYDKIDAECVLAVLPKITTICEIVEKGYTDSVSRLKKDNPVAWYMYYEQRAYITPRSILKIKYLGRYVIFSNRVKKPIFKGSRIGTIDILMGCFMALFLTIIRKE